MNACSDPGTGSNCVNQPLLLSDLHNYFKYNAHLFRIVLNKGSGYLLLLNVPCL